MFRNDSGRSSQAKYATEDRPLSRYVIDLARTNYWRKKEEKKSQSLNTLTLLLRVIWPCATSIPLSCPPPKYSQKKDVQNTPVPTVFFSFFFFG